MAIAVGTLVAHAGKPLAGLCVLTEHEILELLDRLKSAPGQQQPSHIDPLAHWPVLVSRTLCLNLQRVAAAEFARHPERISITAGPYTERALTELCGDYRLVHHVDTGFSGSSLLVAYDTQCLQVLALLSGNENLNGFSAASAYDFSLALADCVEASEQAQRAASAFLTLDMDGDMRCAAGWCLTISAGGVSGSLHIGLVGAGARQVSSGHQLPACDWIDLTVRPIQVGRGGQSSEMSILLGEPICVEHGPAVQQAGYAGQSYDQSLVHQSMRLSPDNVYLLAIEAIGIASTLTFRCQIGSSDSLAVRDDGALRLPDGARFKCTSIDQLPLREGELLMSGGQLRFSCPV